MKHNRIPVSLFLTAILFCMPTSPARAELSPKDSEKIRTLAKTCEERQRRLGDFVRKHSGPAATGTHATTDALPLLSQPLGLSADYWAIRDHSLSLPIRDNASARAFSAIDGRLGQTELSCAGQGDKQVWQFLAAKAPSSKKDLDQFRKQLAPAWRTWVLQQANHRISYAQFTNIMATAEALSKRRLISVPRELIENQKKLDAQLQGATPRLKFAPQISNAQDSKWLTWGRLFQRRGQLERQLLPSSQKLLTELAK